MHIYGSHGNERLAGYRSELLCSVVSSPPPWFLRCRDDSLETFCVELTNDLLIPSWLHDSGRLFYLYDSRFLLSFPPLRPNPAPLPLLPAGKKTSAVITPEYRNKGTGISRRDVHKIGATFSVSQVMSYIGQQSLRQSSSERYSCRC